MGASKTYKGKPGWSGDQSNRGKEPKYSSTPIMKPEGSHMSGEDTFGRKGNKGGGGKSNSISGPKRRSAGASGY